MKKLYTIMAIVLVASMFLTACGSAATPAPTAMPAMTMAATQAPAATAAMPASDSYGCSHLCCLHWTVYQRWHGN